MARYHFILFLLLLPCVTPFRSTKFRAPRAGYSSNLHLPILAAPTLARRVASQPVMSIGRPPPLAFVVTNGQAVMTLIALFVIFRLIRPRDREAEAAARAKAEEERAAARRARVEAEAAVRSNAEAFAADPNLPNL